MFGWGLWGGAVGPCINNALRGAQAQTASLEQGAASSAQGTSGAPRTQPRTATTASSGPAASSGTGSAFVASLRQAATRSVRATP